MQLDEDAQTAACIKLLASVVTLAITDACQKPCRVKNKSGRTHASTRISLDAMRFLMGNGVKSYIENLGMDGDRFKEQLLKQMWDESDRGYLTEKITAIQRKNFRFNHYSFSNIPAAGQPINDDEMDNQ
jgi:hypothetical protein